MLCSGAWQVAHLRPFVPSGWLNSAAPSGAPSPCQVVAVPESLALTTIDGIEGGGGIPAAPGAPPSPGVVVPVPVAPAVPTLATPPVPLAPATPPVPAPRPA